MASPQSFPIVLLVTTFLVVTGAMVIAILLESVGFRQRYRLRRGADMPSSSPSARTALWVRERRTVLHPPRRLNLKG